MAGLFMNPQDVLMAQQAQYAQMTPESMNNTIRGSAFNLGGGLSRGITGLFGGDPRSPVEQRAANLQEIMQGVDYSKPQQVVGAANALNNAGFQAEAFEMMKLLPTPTQPKKTPVGEPFLDWIIDPLTGQRRAQLMQKFQHPGGGIAQEPVGASLQVGSDDDDGPGNLPQAVYKYVTLDDVDVKGLVQKMGALEEFKGIPIIGRDADPEEFASFVADIKKTAQDLQKAQLSQLLPAYESGRMTANELQLRMPTPTEAINTALRRHLQTRSFQQQSDIGMTGGASVELDPYTDFTDPRTMDKTIQTAFEKNQALTQAAAELGQLVKGDVDNPNSFRRGRLTPEQAKSVFTGNLNDEEMVQALTGMGFQFTPEMVESHAKRWQYMREMPQFTAQMAAYLDQPEQFRARTINILDEWKDDFSKFGKAHSIIDYLKKTATEIVGQSNKSKARTRIRGG